MELPEYYKNIRFETINGKTFNGYLEPPFSDEDNPWFSVENSMDEKNGIGGIMYHPNDIVSWEYLPEPPEINYYDVIFE